MEQRSDVSYRAEKLYKHSKGKFGYLIREVVTNAIHATLIKKENNHSYKPYVEVEVTTEKNKIEIVVKDNGEGFNKENSQYFTHLDKKNPQKEKLHFNPMAQGRLSIIYFSDYAEYNSIYKNSEGDYREKSFLYPPDDESSLFIIEDSKDSEATKKETGTNLTIRLIKQSTLNRAETFFSKYSNISKLENWFIENFFPFFMNIKHFELSLKLNNDPTVIYRKTIEDKTNQLAFPVDLSTKQDFILWLFKKETNPKSKNQIVCFARHLSAELDGGKLEYEIELPEAYDWFLTSAYFDNLVDEKGDKIQILENDVEKIQTALNKKLDEHFADQIKINRDESKQNYKNAQKKFRSLATFMDKDQISSTNKILAESDIVNNAIDRKGRSEKNYWTQDSIEDEETERLLNSSLYIYVEHRKRILKKLKKLIEKYDIEGQTKRELEDDIHDIILKRSENFSESDNINHLHNLWLIDDKFTVFSKTQKGKSTSRGQEAADIYLWMDDVASPKELLILELKSTTHSHNTGDRYESMVAQVRRYAKNFYQEPTRLINWDVATNEIIYTGIILARKSDIYKELGSNNLGGTPIQIPFLKSSYFLNDTFTVGATNMPPQRVPIRIEMYSYEDLQKLASDRNNVFFKLLDNEFNIDSDIHEE